MKTTMDTTKIQGSEGNRWLEESGFIEFLSKVGLEVERFDKRFGFGLRYLNTPPDEIDGDSSISGSVAFVVLRVNRLIPERQYCLYTMLKDKVLYGYIGLYRDGNITTIQELSPLQDFKKGEIQLYNWFAALVKASCRK
jgi:hypothetical protein